MATLSVVIPSYNEIDNIQLLCRACSDIFSNSSDVEVILVDNGSTDQTWDVINTLKQTHHYDWLKPVRVEHNKGYGYGVLEGLKKASGDILAWTHADLQTDPQDILEAKACFEAHASESILVKGRRKNRPFLDVFFTAGMQWYCSLLLKVPLSDINAQPKMFSKSFYQDHINDKAPWDFSLDLYCLFMAKKLDMKIYEVPVFFHERRYGEAKGGGSIKTKFKLIRRTVAYIHDLYKQTKK